MTDKEAAYTREEGQGWWYVERNGPPPGDAEDDTDEPLLDLAILSDPSFVGVALAVFVAQCIAIMVACNWKPEAPASKKRD